MKFLDDDKADWRDVEQSENGHFVFNLLSGYAAKQTALISEEFNDEFIALWTDYSSDCEEIPEGEKDAMQERDLQKFWGESHG